MAKTPDTTFVTTAAQLQFLMRVYLKDELPTTPVLFEVLPDRIDVMIGGITATVRTSLVRSDRD